jgi:hypothetical protein
MLEIWEFITGRQQHKVGKDGGDFFRKPRPDKGCSATDDNDEYIYSPTLVNAVGGLYCGIQIWASLCASLARPVLPPALVTDGRASHAMPIMRRALLKLLK